MESEKLQLFENQTIRTAWDEEHEEWYFSIVDVVGVLTESLDGRKYWNKLKQRLKGEGNETVTNCHQLKLKAAGGSASKSAKDSIESAIGYRLLQIKNGRIKSYGYFND